jgi:hypothetical protein
MGGKTFLPFQEEPFHEERERRLIAIRDKMARLDKREARRSDEVVLIDQIVKQYEITAPVLDFGNMPKPTDSEREMDDDSPLGNIARQQGRPRKVKRMVITYRIPLEGDGALLRYQPKNHTSSAPGSVTVGKGEVTFDIVRRSDDPAQIKQEMGEMVRYLQTYSGFLAEDIEAYNVQLRPAIQGGLNARREKLDKDDDFMSQL